MPIRFQVDPDFYDHPKTIDLSDAATALWTRAGSYSTAKLLDGFVPDAMLARLSRTPVDASGELVRRGLWRRVRGGFQFHQWDERNLTRTRVENDREYEREKKRRQRSAQGNPGSVPTGQNRDTPGTPGGVPPVSVSVSVSESVSGSGHGAASYPQNGSQHPGPEPPRRCEDHRTRATADPCGACFEQRRQHGEWVAARNEWQRTAPKCRTHPTELASNCRACAADRKAGGNP